MHIKSTTRYTPRVPLICQECGALFTVKASKAKNGTAKYCSRECHNKSQIVPPLKRFWTKVQIGAIDDCWPWLGICDKDGYGHFSPKRTGNHRAHRFAYEVTNGPIPDGLCVCHSCDNPLCCNPNHLWLGSNLDNISDRDSKGRSAKGVKAHKAKLTPDQVRSIRAEYATGTTTTTKLGQEYGVDHSAISAIIRRKSWASVA